MYEEKKLSRKQKKEIEAQQAREQAEWDAKMAATTEKNKIQKLITEIEKTEKSLMEYAATAKAKGYDDIYRQQLSALKVARARKIQAEKFLFQIKSMEKMKSISNSSSELLNSMGNIMGTLGKLSVDNGEMRKTQQNFMQAQKNLNKMSHSIEQFLYSIEDCIPDEEMFIDDDNEDLSDLLKDEIAALNNSDSASVNADPDIVKFHQLSK